MSDNPEKRPTPLRAAPPPPPSGEYRHKLSKPIMVHGNGGMQEVSEITLRSPTADDILAIGFPYRAIRGSDNGSITIEMVFQAQAVKNWIQRLSGFSQGEFGAMHARDIHAIYNWLSTEMSPIAQDGDLQD